jgi:hypothetical protein
MILIEKPAGTLISFFNGAVVDPGDNSIAAPEETEDLINVLRLKGMVTQ